MQSDPRIITTHVDGLTASVEDWEHRSGAAFEAAEDAMRQSAELVQRAQSTATMALENARTDQAAVERLAAEAARLRLQVEETLRAATAASQAAIAVQTAAQSTLARWQAALAAAQEWLQRAIRAEQQAQAALNHAESSLSGARAELASAWAALNAARSRTEYAGKDSQGRDIYRPVDTSAYVAAVNHAQQQVGYWENEVQRARAALNAAQADRAAAQARVNVCTQSVARAAEGVQCAATAMQSAHAATSAAERALEEQHRADLVVAQTRLDAHQELQAAEAAVGEVGQARDAYGAGEQQYLIAHDLHESARQRSCQCRLEVSWRLDRLRAFDQPIHEF